MKKNNNLKSILFYLFILSSINAFSQMDVRMDNIEYLNNEYDDCETINLNAFNNNDISFDAYVRVPHNTGAGGYVYTYGTLTVWYNSGSAAVPLQEYGINDTHWTYTDSYAYLDISTIYLSLDYSLFDDTEGGGIFIVYHESIQEFMRESCENQITFPKFSISPESVSLNCGDDSEITFYVENENNTPGDLIYQWNVGSGWLRDGNPVSNFTTTSTTVQLSPYQYPPSNVNVTPILNGDSYPTLTSSVSLGGFNPAYQISGANQLCSTATYSVNNLPSGTSVSSWSVSNSNIATISQNGNQATLSANGNGVIYVSATLTNACGQSITISKSNISVGTPTFSGSISGEYNPVVGEYKWYSVQPATGASSYYWYFDVGNGQTGTNIDGRSILYGQGTTSVNVKVGNPGSTVIVCRATNNCGNRITYKYISPRTTTDPCDEYLKVGSNPIKSNNQTGKFIWIEDPCDKPWGNGLNRQVSNKKTINIYNSFGNLVFSKTQTEKGFDINGLKRGLYFVKYQTRKGKMITKKIIME